MPNGFNSALNHKHRIHMSWVYSKQDYCYKCANNMLVIHEIGDIREWQ